MIYFVSGQKFLFTDNDIEQITPAESFKILSAWGRMLQYDSETEGSLK